MKLCSFSTCSPPVVWLMFLQVMDQYLWTKQPNYKASGRAGGLPWVKSWFNQSSRKEQMFRENDIGNSDSSSIHRHHEWPSTHTSGPSEVKSYLSQETSLHCNSETIYNKHQGTLGIDPTFHNVPCNWRRVSNISHHPEDKKTETIHIALKR